MIPCLPATATEITLLSNRISRRAFHQLQNRHHPHQYHPQQINAANFAEAARYTALRAPVHRTVMGSSSATRLPQGSDLCMGFGIFQLGME